MAKKQFKVEAGSYDPLKKETIAGVFVSLTFDTRKHSIGEGKPIPISVRVAYGLARWYYRTGKSYTEADYKSLLNAGNSGQWHDAKKELVRHCDDITTHIKAIQAEGVFSIELLKERASKRAPGAKTTLYDYWTEYALGKKTPKTISQYKSALQSFKTYKGEGSKITVRDVTADMIDGWSKAMEEKGNSNDTRSMYIRAMRALLRHAKEKNVITRVPKIEIPTPNRRTDNYLSVADILKLRSLKAPDTWGNEEKASVRQAIDYWMILYMLNGCNTKDMALLRWEDSYFYDNELSFMRSKMAGRKQKPITIKVPIIAELREMLAQYGSEPVHGELVFPEMIGTAKMDTQIENRVHDINANIRRQVAKACDLLKIRPATAQYARNSFITALTHHGISDSYIDRAVGHADNLLRGYQGEFSPKKRLKFNGLLFVDPEIDNESEELVERLKGIDPKELEKILSQINKNVK